MKLNKKIGELTVKELKDLIREIILEEQVVYTTPVLPIPQPYYVPYYNPYEHQKIWATTNTTMTKGE